MEASLETLLTPEQQTILRAVETASRRMGMPAYLVGGAVRDWLLGQPIGDLDFTVEGDALSFAPDLQRDLGGELALHEKFRTATWRILGQSVDIASARTETYAWPAALPAVAPATLEQDLRRRDFTINAMAVAVGDGSPLDLFGGLADLRAGIIRALHARSFVDDPTRILRAARYAARLGFAVDADTRRWIDAGLAPLNDLSGERVKYDLELIFGEDEPEGALSLLRQWGVFRALGIAVPEEGLLAERYARRRDWAREGDWDCAPLELPMQELLCAMGWGALIYDMGQMSASRWIGLIPFQARVRDALASLGVLSTLSAAAFRAPDSRQSALLSAFSGLALCIGWLFDRDPLKRQAMRAEWHVWRWVKPVTTGDDLRARGLPPGPRYGELLARLRDAWLDHEVSSPDEEQALLDKLLERG